MAAWMVLGCGREPPTTIPPGAKPIELRLDHLRHLGFDVTGLSRSRRIRGTRRRG
jgi:hypothetical protein